MRKILAITSLLAAPLLPGIAAADEDTNRWVAGVGYTTFSESEDDIDISVGAVWGSLGYQIKVSERFRVTPEVRVGKGISGDTIDLLGSPVDVELDSFLAASLRGEYDFQNGAYAFVAPTYAKGEFNVNVGSDFAEGNAWEIGGGFGAGYYFSEDKKVELAYESFDGTNMISLSLKFDF